MFNGFVCARPCRMHTRCDVGCRTPPATIFHKKIKTMKTKSHKHTASRHQHQRSPSKKPLSIPERHKKFLNLVHEIAPNELLLLAIASTLIPGPHLSRRSVARFV